MILLRILSKCYRLKYCRFVLYVLLSLTLSLLLSGLLSMLSLFLPAEAIAQRPARAALIDSGQQHYQAQQFSEAIAAWAQALNISSRETNARTDASLNSLSQAQLLSYLSAAYQAVGQWQAAEDSLSQAMALLPKTDSPQVQQVRAQLDNTWGSLHFARGDMQAALEAWQRAADLYLKTGERSRYLYNQLNQVQAQQALGYYHQARKILQTVADALPTQDASLQAQGYRQLGQTYQRIGDWASAQDSLQKALAIADSATQGAILLDLGNSAQAQGDISQALSYYEAAIARSNPLAKLNQLSLLVHTDPAAARSLIPSLSAELASLPPGRDQIYAHIHAAQSLLQLETADSRDTAVRWLVTAVQRSVDLQDSRAEAYAKGYLAHAYEVSEQWPEATSLTQAALLIAQSINAADIAYQWHWQLGRLLQRQGQSEQAIAAYRQAYLALQSLKQDLVAMNQSFQFSFQESVEPVYRELVSLLLASDDTTTSSTAASTALPIAQSAVQSAVQSTAQSTAQKNARLSEARQVIESLQIAELDNFFRTACLTAQQVNLEAVEQTAAAVIYPIVLPDRLELVVSLPGQSLHQYTTSISQLELEQTVADWRIALERPFTAPEGKDLGQTLYHWLIEPLQADLETSQVQTLVFVPDGALRNVPMAALYDGDRYLIERYAISLSPSLQLLGPRPIQETTITATLGGLTQARHGFSPLANVDKELQTVQSLVNSRLLLDETFTTQNIIDQLASSERPIIHLATHGQFSSKLGETFVLAWDKPILANELGALIATGDQNRIDPIELLILSACKTANGDRRAALGLSGVAIQSGARSTLASLWNLDDASGAAFIEQFYKALITPQTTKAEALRAAQLTLLKDPNYRHPFHWAAYVLVGNWL